MNAAFSKLDSLCKSLRMDSVQPADFLHGLPDNLSPMEVLTRFLETQQAHKQEQAANARITKARFPRIKAFDEYDFTLQNGVTADQMKRLCDFLWLEQAFNVVFLGAPGVGKTHLATALGGISRKSRLSCGFYHAGGAYSSPRDRGHLRRQQASSNHHKSRISRYPGRNWLYARL